MEQPEEQDLIMPFGPQKGKRIADLTVEQLHSALLDINPNRAVLFETLNAAFKVKAGFNWREET